MSNSHSNNKQYLTIVILFMDVYYDSWTITILYVSSAIHLTDCILTVYWLYTDCILTAYWLCTDCILIIYWLYTGCILTVYWLYTDCILAVYWLYTDCILTVYWLYTHCILTVYWLCTHCILSDLYYSSITARNFNKEVEGQGPQVPVKTWLGRGRGSRQEMLNKKLYIMRR